ncbi:MAG: hypothetical protein J5496_06825 [Lachnospiraceae bacterium]|nr:hypothetical protein [Lachnospiraceae bacterium]
MPRKSFVSILIVFALLFCCYAPAEAAEQNGVVMNENVIHKLKDGSRLVEKPLIVLSRTTSYVTASKTYEYENSDGVVEWSAKITGSFTYTGTTSFCTSSACVTTVYSGNWHEAVNNASYAGNAAFASVTMELKFLFIVIKTQNVSLTLTCDANGNLS